MKTFALFLLFLTVSVGMQQLPAAEKVQRKALRAKENENSCKSQKCCHTSPQCPKKFRLPRVDIAKTSVQCKGSLVLDRKTSRVFVSDGNQWIELEENLPAPQLILVDPNIKENGVTQFHTIQEAIDSLGDQSVLNTTIKIAPGTYAENVVLDGILATSGNAFKIIGDERKFVGCGIAHDSFWNTNLSVPATLPVGGGVGSKAVLSAAGNTLTVTASVGISPDFTGAGNPLEAIVPGDRVAIRNDAGAFNAYTIAPGGVTPSTLTFTTPIVGTVGGLGSAMCIFPNVAIEPVTGDCIQNSVFVTLQGLALITHPVQVSPSQAPSALMAHSNSGNFLTNLLMFGPGCGIWGKDDTNTITSSGFNVHGRSVVQCITPLGISIMGSSASGAFAGTGNQCFICAYNASWTLLASLISPDLTANAGSSQFNSVLRMEFCKVLSGTSIALNITNTSKAQLDLPNDIMCLGGTGILIVRDSSVQSPVNNGPLINIRGAPAIGIDVQNSNFGSAAANNTISLSSTNPAFIGIRMGNSGNNAGVSNGVIAFGALNIPASATAYIAQVNNGSTLQVLSVAGPVTLGANSNGFLVQNGSSLLWTAAGATGSIAGNAATTLVSGVKLFDIQDASTLVMPSGAQRTFTNFPIIFNFDNKSNGDIYNSTSTTIAGGTNLVSQNYSSVEVDTLTFNASGANVGIKTAKGGFVGKKSGTVLTNSTPFLIDPSSCQQLSTDPIGSYACTDATGLIIVN